MLVRFFQNVEPCGIVENAAPCDEIPTQPFSIRVHWDSPSSRGYGSYVPPDSYQIEYYLLEVSQNATFETLFSSRRCNTGQADDFTDFDEATDFCNFDQRIAILTGLTKTQEYYFRISAGTVIGDGESSGNVST